VFFRDGEDHVFVPPSLSPPPPPPGMRYMPGFFFSSRRRAAADFFFFWGIGDACALSLLFISFLFSSGRKLEEHFVEVFPFFLLMAPNLRMVMLRWIFFFFFFPFSPSLQGGFFPLSPFFSPLAEQKRAVFSFPRSEWRRLWEQSSPFFPGFFPPLFPGLGKAHFPADNKVFSLLPFFFFFFRPLASVFFPFFPFFFGIVQLARAFPFFFFFFFFFKLGDGRMVTVLFLFPPPCRRLDCKEKENDICSPFLLLLKDSQCFTKPLFLFCGLPGFGHDFPLSPGWGDQRRRTFFFFSPGQVEDSPLPRIFFFLFSSCSTLEEVDSSPFFL